MIKDRKSKSLGAFRELDVSQVAMCLSAEIYVLTHVSARKGSRIATDGMRRAADALPAALMQRQAIRGMRDMANHVSAARVLVAELEGLLMLGEESGDFKPEQLKHIFSLMRYIKNYCSMFYMIDEPQGRMPQLAS